MSDVLFDRVLAGLFGIDGNFEFFFVAKASMDDSDPDAHLMGRVYMFAKSSGNLNIIEDNLDSIFSKLRIIESYPSKLDQVTAIFVSLHELLKESSEILMDALVQRDGVVTLKDIVWRSSAQNDNSRIYAKSQNTDIEEDIVDQFYFFIRDICHTHQHHGPDADTIITTHKCSDEDNSWKSHIIYSLYFHIINMKRRNDSVELTRALGILAYVKSFQSIVSRHNASLDKTLRETKGCKLPSFNNEATHRSIEASRSYLELSQSRERHKNSTINQFLYWGVGIIVTLMLFVIGIAEDKVKAPQQIVEWANWLKGNPSALVFPFLFAVIVKCSTIIRGLRPNILSDVVRMFFINKAITVTVLILVAMILFLGAYYFGFVLVRT